MPWARLTDTAATHPIVLAVAEHPDADDRSVNEVFGFMLRLAAMSAQYLTDYVFWYSSAVQMAGSKSQADHLLGLAAFAGYGVQDVEPGSGRRFFRLVADPDFVHIKTAEEVAWERDRKANNGLSGMPASSLRRRLTGHWLSESRNTTQGWSRAALE